MDLKQYEPAMRHLIDSYIGAEVSRILANFENMSLVVLLVEKEKNGLNAILDSIKKNRYAKQFTQSNPAISYQ